MAVVALLAGCAAPQAPQYRHDDLQHDQQFSRAAVDVDPARVFALSGSMEQYLQSDILPRIRANGVQGALIEALVSKGQLKLKYDATTTRNAAEAFDARAGNCLSLVIMTAAFARQLGLQVRYQSASGRPHGEKTIWQDVKRLRPATILKLKNGNVTEVEYWSPTIDESVAKMSFDEALEKAFDILSRTFRCVLQRRGNYGQT